jgi:arylformamidase
VTFLIFNYDLCPLVTVDEIIRQARASVAWAYHSARIFGGDPNRISVFGHSAGTQIAARTLETDWSEFDRVPDDVITSMIGVSGVSDLEPIRLSSTNNDVRLDAEAALRNSPMLRPLRRRVPMLLAYGTTDNSEFQRQTKDFAAALRQKNYDCECLEIEGSNHFTILDDMSDPSKSLCKRMVELTKAAR